VTPAAVAALMRCSIDVICLPGYQAASDTSLALPNGCVAPNQYLAVQTVS